MVVLVVVIAAEMAALAEVVVIVVIVVIGRLPRRGVPSGLRGPNVRSLEYRCAGVIRRLLDG